MNPSLFILAASTLLLGLGGCAAPTPAASGANEKAPLVAITVTDGPAENNQRLDASFTELERGADQSIVAVVVRSGGSVSSSMFTLRGTCAVMRARGAQYVKSEVVAGQARSFRLTFPASASASELSGPSKSVFSTADCNALRF